MVDKLRKYLHPDTEMIDHNLEKILRNDIINIDEFIADSLRWSICLL